MAPARSGLLAMSTDDALIGARSRFLDGNRLEGNSEAEIGEQTGQRGQELGNGAQEDEAVAALDKDRAAKPETNRPCNANRSKRFIRKVQQ